MTQEECDPLNQGARFGQNTQPRPTRPAQSRKVGQIQIESRVDIDAVDRGIDAYEDLMDEADAVCARLGT